MKINVPIFVLIALFIFACKTNSISTQDKQIENFGTAEYYQKYKRNIDRLYNMLQGTFVCYYKTADAEPSTWIVNQDSIVIYTIPIKEPAKDGYWLISYQFITGLPNEPLYAGLQKITSIDRDTFLLESFESPVEIRLTDIIKDLNKLDASINLDSLIPEDDITTFCREEITLFKGFSNIYKDPQNTDLRYRQDISEIHPDNITSSQKYSEDIKGKKDVTESSTKTIVRRTQKDIIEMTDKSFLEE